MQSEIDSLKQRISELEAEKVELETKNAELLKQVMEENAKREAENAELKARIAKLEQTPTKDILPHIESHSDEEKGITPDPLPEIEYSSTQSESSMEPKTSITSLPQDIIDDDSAETLDFVETIYKERISSEIRERNREKKLQESHNDLTSPISSKVSTMPLISDTDVTESLDSKTVKKLGDKSKSQNEISQSHKKKGTENIAQVIADGIQDALVHSSADNTISDSNHVTEISATARRQNSDTISLLDLAQLFDKATNAEHYAMKANQEETLCLISFVEEGQKKWDYNSQKFHVKLYVERLKGL